MSRFAQHARQVCARRPLLGITFASCGIAFGAFLAGCPQSQIDIDFGDSGTSSASDGQVVPIGCDLTKDPKDSPACIDDSIALFVSLSGKDTNAGTKAAPLQTIKAALAKVDAQHDRVYVCEGTYPEKVELSATATASLFGGFACADWSDSGKVVKIAPNAHGSAVSILGVASPITIGDLEIDAPNAQLSGESSIAAFVSNSAGVTFSNDVVNAGSGAKGTDGSIIEYLYSTDNAGNSASGATGGAAKTVICESGVTVGGKGGDNGFPGDPGQPDIDGGTGGAGGTGTVCTTGVGSDGTPGLPGANGSGATNVGSIDQTGWTPSTGSPGGIGGTGQGGGGGAGFTGNGGGSGGAGGCGGASGAPGFGGGGSIGILIFASPVTISKSQITTSTAGNGGAGIAGQPGQTPGGAHGNGAGSACQGGNGGAGGPGGPTGGGAGGVSIGVFYKNANAPVIDADTKFNGPTSGGTKGIGGAPGANDGVDGIAGTVIENK